MPFYQKRGTGRIILSCVLVLLIAVVFYLSLCGSNILPKNCKYGLYTVDETNGFVPDGSLVLVDKTAETSGADKVVAEINGSVSVCADADAGENAIGPVKSEIYYLGYAVSFFNQFRYYICTLCVLAFAGIIVFNATANVRFKKKRKKMLIELFDEYGEHFDSEDGDSQY